MINKGVLKVLEIGFDAHVVSTSSGNSGLVAVMRTDDNDWFAVKIIKGLAQYPSPTGGDPESRLASLLLADPKPLEELLPAFEELAKETEKALLVQPFKNTAIAAAQELFVRETYKWIRCARHRNIISPLEIKRLGDMIAVRMEYCPFSLHDYIEKHANPAGVTAACFIGAQLLAALGSISNLGYEAHQDVKPRNVLLQCQSPAESPDRVDWKDVQVRLADFGLLSARKEAGIAAGTLRYMAPEQHEPERAGHLSKADVFSVGVILYELAHRLHPGGTGFDQQKKKAGYWRSWWKGSLSLGASVSREFDELIGRLLNVEPSRRPTHAEAIATLQDILRTTCPEEAKLLELLLQTADKDAASDASHEELLLELASLHTGMADQLFGSLCTAMKSEASTADGAFGEALEKVMLAKVLLAKNHSAPHDSGRTDRNRRAVALAKRALSIVGPFVDLIDIRHLRVLAGRVSGVVRISLEGDPGVVMSELESEELPKRLRALLYLEAASQVRSPIKHGGGWIQQLEKVLELLDKAINLSGEGIFRERKAMWIHEHLVLGAGGVIEVPRFMELRSIALDAARQCIASGWEVMSMERLLEKLNDLKVCV